MSHNINKENIFNFLKSESVVVEIDINNEIEILETANMSNPNSLQKVTLKLLNNTSKYWQLNPETTTFLQPYSKKVESIILEQTEDDTLNIFLIEMKSSIVNESDVIEKFEKSLSWVYLLLNLLKNKENQIIKVFGILVAQQDKSWNERDTLTIFSSTAIRYKKKSFYTTNTSIDISINDLLS